VSTSAGGWQVSRPGVRIAGQYAHPPRDRRGPEAAGLLQPPHTRLQMRPLRRQRDQDSTCAPAQENTQVGGGTNAGGVLEPVKVGAPARTRWPRLVPDEEKDRSRVSSGDDRHHSTERQRPCTTRGVQTTTAHPKSGMVARERARGRSGEPRGRAWPAGHTIRSSGTSAQSRALGIMSVF
jgi:hypothetical protein